jgi:hypothetical protein
MRRCPRSSTPRRRSASWSSASPTCRARRRRRCRSGPRGRSSVRSR